MLKNPLGIIYAVDRCDLRQSGTPRFPVFPFSLLHLDMSGILQHDTAKLGGRLGCVDFAPKASGVQKRKISGVVYVRVRYEDVIYKRRVHRDILIYIEIRSLFHSAVYKYMLSANLNIVTAAGDLVVGAKELNAHRTPSFSV